MKTKYNHISKWERKRIEGLMQAGKANKEIAEELGRSKSTIGRELKRNCQQANGDEYKSDVAEKVAKKRQERKRKLRIPEGIWQKIFDFYNEDWSPEQIAGALKLQGISVSHETIYRRIYAEILAGRLVRELFEKSFP